MRFNEKTGQLYVDIFQRSYIKSIFCAGSACLPSYLPGQISPLNFKSEDFSASQGEIAAYNVLSLKIPQYHTPFKFLDFGGRIFKQIGTSSLYNKVYVFGKVSTGKFLAIYGENENGILFLFLFYYLLIQNNIFLKV